MGGIPYQYRSTSVPFPSIAKSEHRIEEPLLYRLVPARSLFRNISEELIFLIIIFSQIRKLISGHTFYLNLPYASSSFPSTNAWLYKRLWMLILIGSYLRICINRFRFFHRCLLCGDSGSWRLCDQLYDRPRIRCD